jgi:hypothetical protein
MSTKLTSAVLSNIGVTLMTMLVLLPTLPGMERFLFPVVSKMGIISSTTTGDGLSLWVSFEKYRSCEFVDLTFKQNGDRVSTIFPPEDEYLPTSRPEGEWVTGPWVVDIETLDGLEVVVEHRCHFLWNTFTQLYP